MKRTFILALVLGFSLLPAARPAEAEDNVEWTVKGKAVSGTETIREDQRSSKFYEYRDLPAGFFLNGLELTLTKGARFIEFSADRIGRKDGSYNFALGSRGKYKLSLGANLIPHIFSFEGRTLFYEIQPGVFIFPDPIQQAAQTAAGNAPYANRDALNALVSGARSVVSSYLSGAIPIGLAIQRNKSTLGFTYEISAPLSFNINAFRETRKGTRPIGAPLGFSNLIELPEPIDTATTNIEASLEFNPGWGTFQAGYFSSVFKNDVQTLRWDNPLRFTDQTFSAPQGAYSPGNGSALGQLNLPPTNRAHRFYLNASARVVRSVRLMGAVSYGVFSQNETLLPSTVNTAIGLEYPGSMSAPAASANAKAVVGTADFTLSAHIIKNLNLTAGYRYYNFGNKTQELHLEGFSVLDQVWDAIPETIEPYSYSRSKLFGNVSFRFMKNTSLQLGYNRSTFARKLGQEDEGQNKEAAFKASLDSTPVSWFWLRASFLSGKREWSLEGEKDIYIPGFAFRRYHEANRDRRTWTVAAGLSPFRNFDLAFSTSTGEDKYPQSEYGLKKSDVRMISAEASYALGQRGSLYGFYSQEKYSGDQASRKSNSSTFSTNPADDWTAALKDTFRTLGAGITLTVVRDKLDFDISYSNSKAKGTVDLYSPPGGDPGDAADFDKNIDSTAINIIKTKVLWKLNPAFALAAGYWFERYTIEDISRTRREVDKLSDSNAIYLGALEPDYRYHIGYLKFIFNW